MLFIVSYRARGLSTGWINQEAAVAAESAEAAKAKFEGIMARTYASGSWFVDWAIVSASRVN